MVVGVGAVVVVDATVLAVVFGAMEGIVRGVATLGGRSTGAGPVIGWAVSAACVVDGVLLVVLVVLVVLVGSAANASAAGGS